MNTKEWGEYKQRQRADRWKAKYPRIIWGGKLPSFNTGVQPRLQHSEVPFQGTAMKIDGEYEEMPRDFRPHLHGTRSQRRAKQRFI